MCNSGTLFQHVISSLMKSLCFRFLLKSHTFLPLRQITFSRCSFVPLFGLADVLSLLTRTTTVFSSIFFPNIGWKCANVSTSLWETWSRCRTNKIIHGLLDDVSIYLLITDWGSLITVIHCTPICSDTSSSNVDCFGRKCSNPRILFPTRHLHLLLTPSRKMPPQNSWPSPVKKSTKAFVKIS